MLHLPNAHLLKGIISIEGNIGSGKTTLEAGLVAALASSKVVFVDEPLNNWREKKYEGGEESALSLFYGDTKKYALSFQIKTFTTRQRSFANTMTKADQPITLISERSMLSDKLFFENLHRSRHAGEFEWDVYQEFFQTVSGTTNQKHKVMIYLDVDYQTCHRRLTKRSRGEESAIPLEYLESLENMHEEMLARFEAEGGTIIRAPWRKDTEDGSLERQQMVDHIADCVRELLSSTSPS